MSTFRRRGAHAARPAGAAPPAARRAQRPGGGARAHLGSGTWEMWVTAARSRAPMVRIVVAVVVLAAGTLGFGGLLATPSAEPTVQAFLLAWQQENYRAAATLTTGRPAAVASALRSAFRGLDAAAFYLWMGPTSQHGSTAHAHFRASVDLGQNGAPWNYTGSFRLRRQGSSWKIIWSPSVINPGLRPGLHLAQVSTTPPRAGLLDASGTPLQIPSPVYEVGVWPGRLAHPGQTARELGSVTKIDPAQLLGWIQAAPRKPFLTLLTLPPGQYHRLRGALGRIPGVHVGQRMRRLFTSIAPLVVGSVGTEASAVLREQGIAYRPGATVGLSGLQRKDQQTLAGTPTTEVVTETSSGRHVSVLKRWAGRPSEPVRTTLDAPAQLAANQAVGLGPGSAAIVAVQASTGRILAVAGHQAAGMPAVEPLRGRYPPGMSFSIVSAEAMLASGLPIDASVRCPAKSDVGGHTITTVGPRPRLGAQPPFWKAFASACTTALAAASQRLTARDIATVAQGFGLGASWHMALPAFSGWARPSGSVAGLASDAIGEGDEQVSPLAMALVAAQVASGTWHAPTLVAGSADAGRSRPVPFGATNLAALRTLMRDVVHSGAATQADLSGGPAVHGQVGSVSLGQSAHGVWAHWFVGYRGDIAFTVLSLTRSAGTSAVPLAAHFLAAAPVG